MNPTIELQEALFIACIHLRSASDYNLRKDDLDLGLRRFSAFNLELRDATTLIDIVVSHVRLILTRAEESGVNIGGSLFPRIDISRSIPKSCAAWWFACVAADAAL